MREPKLPTTGPIRVDACKGGAVLASRKVETLARRLRAGARVLLVEVDEPASIDAVSRWARRWCAPYDVTPTGADRWVLRITLLPAEFGEAPLPAVRALAVAPRELAELAA